ncbi:MAG TPA: tetratricopeptide repeat protein [Bryobacteraceae bacterium]|jgi:uncharacterized protein (TIGR02996 family)
MTASQKFAALCLVTGVLVVGVYSNHFGNAFHFDDNHSIVDNPYVRDLHNIPRFFEDGSTASVLPPNRAWRPLVMTSVAIDYWLGKGLDPFYFHLSTMIWFLVQLGLMVLLFRNAFDKSQPDPRNRYAALFAAALYGFHPVMAETVNYIIQRAEVYSTLGVLGGLVMYVCWPRSRRTGLYLIPVIAGIVSKTPAVVFPVMLVAYLYLFDKETPRAAFKKAIPSIILVIALVWLTSALTPKTLNTGATSKYAFLITQPFVLLHFFLEFLVPVGLNADNGHVAFQSIFATEAMLGFLFLGGLFAAIVYAARRQSTRPIAFGLIWFFVAAVPAASFPVAEVDNDHRMFFPLVGLAMAGGWGLALAVYRWQIPRTYVAAATAVILCACAYGTRERNEVWHTEESLWHDVAMKSPQNGRGLMNYGLTLMARGDYPGALDYFHRAERWSPNYYVLEINLGVATGAIHQNAEAEKHFLRAIQLAPTEADPRFFYARWLRENGRTPEAVPVLKSAIQLNPSRIDAQYLLMQSYADLLDVDDLRAAAQKTLAQFPTDTVAAGWLAKAADFHPTAEGYLNQSLLHFQAGQYAASIASAKQALALRPGYSDAWNNICAAWNALGGWQEGARAGEEAVRLNPNSQLAKNNLAWSKSHLPK